jgi:ADP-ribosylglycohydrolase
MDEDSIADLFQREPSQWGGRGDPYLWRALAERFGATRLPESEQALVAAVHEGFAALTGRPITSDEHIYVERFAHGGMSSGMIAAVFWRETALPLLCARYAACRHVIAGGQIRGALYGLLVGDALGVPYEFSPPEAQPALHDIDMEPPPGFARAHRGVPVGTWSDDGAQALCLLASLLHHKYFNVDDFARRMLNWYEHGYMAVDGEVFDVGVQTSAALRSFRDGASLFDAARRDPQANGNGALMRVLPLALWHRGSDAELARDARMSSLPTHGHLRSALCCALYCLWIRRTLERSSSPWDDAVRSLRELVAAEADALSELHDHIRPDAPAGARGTGYVVDTLHGAIELQARGTYAHVVRAAVALGHDTDTTAAVAGGAAGARDGLAAIPAPWLHALRGRELVEPLLQQLLEWRRCR